LKKLAKWLKKLAKCSRKLIKFLKKLAKCFFGCVFKNVAECFSGSVFEIEEAGQVFLRLRVRKRG
jgi:hypothetical protein